MKARGRWVVVAAAAAVLVAGACDSGSDDRRSITVYSGREEELAGPVIELFEQASGIRVDVRYGDTSELAATILEEGGNSPADVFFGQDAGALGALAAEDRLVELPPGVLSRVPAAFRSAERRWVGTSGRARTVVFNTDAVDESDLPDSILDFTSEEWEGRVGWAPTNGSFQAFVTALRELRGDAAAAEWLEGMASNGVQEYPKNTPIVQAVIDGEIDVGFVNHYYLLRFLAEDPDAPAANAFLPGGDPGALVNVAGVAVLDTSDDRSAAVELVEFLLSERAQRYFAAETFEYPLVAGVDAVDTLPSLDEIEHPDIDLSDLDDLEGTLELLTEAGLL